MAEITVTLTDTQMKGLEYAAYSPQEWAENALIERARSATNKIVSIYTERALDEGISIPATRDEIVIDAFARGWVKTAADRETEAQAALAERA